MSQFFTKGYLDKCIASDDEITLAMRYGEMHVDMSSDGDKTCEVTCYVWQGRIYITDIKYSEGTKI